MKRYIILMMIFSFSCAGIDTKGELPTGTAVGYVKFYYLRSEGRPPSIVDFYLSDRPDAQPHMLNSKDNWKHIGQAWKSDQPGQDEVWLRIAKKPGTYKILIKGEGIMTSVYSYGHTAYFDSISIQEGMITPIKLTFGKTYRISGPDTKFSLAIMDVTVEKPIPKDEPRK